MKFKVGDIIINRYVNSHIGTIADIVNNTYRIIYIDGITSYWDIGVINSYYRLATKAEIILFFKN